MTPSEIARLLQTVEKRWPHAALPLGSGDVWLEDLSDVPAEEAHAAVVAFARAGERFPPTSGWVRSEIDRRAQAPAPSFDEAQRWVGRHIARIGLVDPRGPEDTATAIERFAMLGAHEVVLRWVQAVGIYSARMAPDGSLHALDFGQSADRRDAARHYDRQVVPDWRAEPRPGLALERARLALGEGRGELRQITDAARQLPAAGE